MWSEEPGIAKVLFNAQKSDLTYQITQDMWFEEPSMTKVLFDN